MKVGNVGASEMYRLVPKSEDLAAIQAFAQFIGEQIKIQEKPQVQFKSTDEAKIVKILDDLGPESRVFKMTDRPRIIYANETGLDCFV